MASLHHMEPPGSASGSSNVRRVPGTCTRGGGFKATCLTCAGGGAGLTSLREGRRHAAAFLRRPQAPAIVDNHPHASQL